MDYFPQKWTFKTSPTYTRNKPNELDTHTPPHTMPGTQAYDAGGSWKSREGRAPAALGRSEEGMPPGGEVGSGRQAGLHGVEDLRARAEERRRETEAQRGEECGGQA